MPMGLDESRQHQLSTNVNHFSVWPNIIFHGAYITNEDNDAVSNGNSLSPRQMLVDRVDSGVGYNYIS
jgi:hypothetical protein